MSDIRSRFKLMPLHGIVMCIAATLSFVSVFIPMFELFVQYKRERVYSLFSIIMNPKVYVELRDCTVDPDDIQIMRKSPFSPLPGGFGVRGVKDDDSAEENA